ncbi:hypothetical protein VSH64_16600 [Amycolatopsis rhabdoformis]|uniref:Lipoprotein n=1 Tax=Amycolatopsis rhabdoformis TaxID=1448059 RepID=A0ABZ1IIC8_9PSEU|nr:hypothetical protein [Amycolatopsis rhabdoformis]WSE33707.1 hypothetical protein VSH64_16600 [Amycolatopsis rhabdoformis]
MTDQTSGHRVRRAGAVIGALLGALAVTVACSNDQSGQPPASSAVSAPASPAPTTSRSATECSAVTTAAQNLATKTAALVTGQASRDEVTTAARDLRSALDAARDTLGPQARSDLDAAGTALQQLQDVLTTQPLDVTALRAAATQVATSIGAVVSVCGGTSTPSSTPSGATTT